MKKKYKVSKICFEHNILKKAIILKTELLRMKASSPSNHVNYPAYTMN